MVTSQVWFGGMEKVGAIGVGTGIATVIWPDLVSFALSFFVFVRHSKNRFFIHCIVSCLVLFATLLALHVIAELQLSLVDSTWNWYRAAVKAIGYGHNMNPLSAPDVHLSHTLYYNLSLSHILQFSCLIKFVGRWAWMRREFHRKSFKVPMHRGLF